MTAGIVAPGYEPVLRAFETMLTTDPDYGAQLCAYVGGRRVVDLVGGEGVTAGDLRGVFSVTKGVAALTIALLLDTGELELEQTVARYWPEFAQNGKQHITVRQLLSHQAGLPSIRGGVLPSDVLASSEGAARLAAERPGWRPGAAFGYHGLTIGIVMEELTKRITGTALQELYEREIRAPRSIDVHLGLTGPDTDRYRDVLPPRAVASRLPSAYDSISDIAFGPLGEVSDPSLSRFGAQSADMRARGPAAAGGVASAAGLARLYAAALGNIGHPFVRRETLEEMAQIQVSGLDLILDVPMRFGVVFMKPHSGLPYGSSEAFGHDGVGGALSFADPTYDLGFGYVPARMTSPSGADHRAIDLARSVRVCARDTAKRRGDGSEGHS